MRDSAQVPSDDPRVMKDANGRAMLSPELVVVANMRRKDGADINVTVRGVSQMAFKVRTGVEVTDGRNFRPGLYEVVVGRKIFERIEGMAIGRSFKLQRREWKVVVVFDANGSGFEMYALVAARTREIGTLRALRFSRVSILIAFVVESTFLAMVGGALGCLIALPANGMTSAAGGTNFSEVAFAFRISGASLAVGMVLAVLMGAAGGVLPAFRAARMPITSALRGT